MVDFTRSKKTKKVTKTPANKMASKKEEISKKSSTKKVVTTKAKGKGGLLEKLRKEAVKTQKEKESREANRFNRVDFFKPEKGKNSIRILPHWKSPEDEFFFVKKVVHYIPALKQDKSGVIKIPALCQKEHFGKPCLICKVADKAQTLTKSAGKKDQETPSRLFV